MTDESAASETPDGSVRAALQRFAERHLTLHAVWVVALIGSLAIVLLLKSIQPNDFWWHVRMGQLILERGTIPTTDEFTFTRAGDTWVNQAWLMQVFLYLTFQAGGAAAVLFAHALTITGAFVLLLLAVRGEHRGRAAPAAVVLAATVGAVNWAVRPQSASFLGMGALIYLIESHRRGARRRFWLTVPLFAIWANAHGSFIFGVAILGLYVSTRLAVHARKALGGGLNGDDRSEAIQLATVGLLSVAALALNPEGPIGIGRYVVSFAEPGTVTRYGTEFARLDPLAPDGVLVLGSAIFLAALARKRWREVAIDQWLAVFVLLALTLWARRVAPWYGFALATPLSILIAPWFAARPSRGSPAVNAAIIGVIVVAVAVAIPSWREAMPRLPVPLLSEQTPIEATSVLCEQLPDDARVYQDFAFASYQEWACPRLLVFSDTRLELYPIEQWADYFLIAGAFDGWEDTLDSYSVSHLFLSQERQRGIIEQARASDCWRSLYRDDRAEIFEGLCLDRA